MLLITNLCMIMEDFNVDIQRDSDKTDEWMDSDLMTPMVSDSNISFRSNRVIDYVVTTNIDL